MRMRIPSYYIMHDKPRSYAQSQNHRLSAPEFDGLDQLSPSSNAAIRRKLPLYFPILSPFILYHPYIPHLKNINSLVSFLFSCTICAWVIVQKSIWLCGKKTHHRQVTDIKNTYNFLLPEAVCCCLKTLFMKVCHVHQCAKFCGKGYSIGKL